MAGPSQEKSNQQNIDLSTIDLGNSRYNFEYLVFPNDLGMDNNPHYMIININEPTQTLNPDRPASSYNNQFDLITGADGFSKVDKLRYGKGVSNLYGGVASSDGANRIGLSLQRRTRRIAESIALHMPNPMVYNTQNAYEEISLTALAGKIGTTAFASIGNIISGVTQRVQGAISRGGAGGISNPVGPGGIVTTASKLLQSPINPAVEILFATTMVRQFTFEVLMAPRNETESKAMHRIIQRLRFHAAPEVSGATAKSIIGENVVTNNLPFMDLGGLFWIPPAEFDITFYHMGVENTNILRVNTCVLERIEVDYAPAGTYSTFRNGHPVAVRLSMGFRELEPIHRTRVLQGF